MRGGGGRRMADRHFWFSFYHLIRQTGKYSCKQKHVSYDDNVIQENRRRQRSAV